MVRWKSSVTSAEGSAASSGEMREGRAIRWMLPATRSVTCASSVGVDITNWRMRNLASPSPLEA